RLLNRRARDSPSRRCASEVLRDLAATAPLARIRGRLRDIARMLQWRRPGVSSSASIRLEQLARDRAWSDAPASSGQPAYLTIACLPRARNDNELDFAPSIPERALEAPRFLSVLSNTPR